MAPPRPRIALAVTSDVSLILMRGFPEYLVSHGWEVHVVSSPGEQLERLSALPHVMVHPLAMRREPSPFHDLVALVRWVGLLRTVKPDVLSAGTPKAGLLGMIAGRLARVPHRVYHLRGLRLETTRGIRRQILAMTERIATGSANRVLAVSHSLMTQMINLRLVAADKILVLGGGSSNGVNVSEFDSANFSADDVTRLREELGVVEGVPVIGFVGRLNPDKGLGMLESALDLLAAQGLDHQLLVIGGQEGRDSSSSSPDLRPEGRRPIYAGAVSQPAIYYQLMDVLCLPTRREGFPNVVLEAAASCIPTVTTTATGAVDSVIDGVTGFLSPPESEEIMARQLGRIIQDDNLRRRMGSQARSHVTANYDRTRVWALSANFYCGLLGADTEAGETSP